MTSTTPSSSTSSPVLRELIKNKRELLEHELYCAVCQGKEDIVSELLGYGILKQKNACDYLTIAMQDGRVKIATLIHHYSIEHKMVDLVYQSQMEYYFCLAAKTGETEIVAHFIPFMPHDGVLCEALSRAAIKDQRGVIDVLMSSLSPEKVLSQIDTFNMDQATHDYIYSQAQKKQLEEEVPEKDGEETTSSKLRL